MTCLILEKAASDPLFLLQTNAYILNAAVWRVKEQARRQRRLQTVPLTEGIAVSEDDGDTMDVAAVLAALPAELRQVVDLMLQEPGAYLTKSSNRVNATRLARELGMSPWAAKSRLDQIRAIGQEAGLVGMMA